MMGKLCESISWRGGCVVEGGRSPAWCYRVGEPFVPGCDHWRPGAELAVEDGWYHLKIFHSDPDRDAARVIREGTAELAILHERPLLVLGYRFGQEVGWADLPFAWHLAVGRGRTPRLDYLSGILFGVSLVDAGTGLIKAQRALPLDAGFAGALSNILRDQAQAPFDARAYTAAVVRHYLDGRNTEARLDRAIARTCFRGSPSTGGPGAGGWPATTSG